MAHPRLTVKQEKFVLEYFKTGNATNAALIAGYSKHTATRIASENLTKLDVINRLTELQEKAASKKIASVIERKEILTGLARNHKGKHSPIEAIKELNKMEGVYPSDKLDITSNGNEIKTAPVIQVVNIETINALTRIENGERTEPAEINNHISEERRSLPQPADQAGT